MDNNFRRQLYKISLNNILKNKVGMCNLILTNNEIHHYGLHNYHTISINNYIVKDTNVIPLCSQVVENNTSTHEELSLF